MIGKEIGDGKVKRAWHIFQVTTGVSVCLFACTGFLVYMFQESIVGIYTPNVLVADYVCSYMMLVCAILFLDGLQALFQGTIRGLGLQDKATKYVLASNYLIGVPLAYTLTFKAEWRTEGLLCGVMLACSFSTLFYFVLIVTANWRELATKAEARIELDSSRLTESKVYSDDESFQRNL